MGLEVKNGAVNVYIKTKEYMYTFTSFGGNGKRNSDWQLKLVGKYGIYLEKRGSVDVDLFLFENSVGRFWMDCWQFCMSSSITVIV